MIEFIGIGGGVGSCAKQEQAKDHQKSRVSQLLQRRRRQATEQKKTPQNPSINPQLQKSARYEVLAPSQCTIPIVQYLRQGRGGGNSYKTRAFQYVIAGGVACSRGRSYRNSDTLPGHISETSSAPAVLLWWSPEPEQRPASYPTPRPGT